MITIIFFISSFILLFVFWCILKVGSIYDENMEYNYKKIVKEKENNKE